MSFIFAGNKPSIFFILTLKTKSERSNQCLRGPVSVQCIFQQWTNRNYLFRIWQTLMRCPDTTVSICSTSFAWTPCSSPVFQRRERCTSTSPASWLYSQWSHGVIIVVANQPGNPSILKHVYNHILDINMYCQFYE